jgi:hypothetical protein
MRARVISVTQVGETTELFFSVWNRATGKFLTEEFQVRLTAQGISVCLSVCVCVCVGVGVGDL